MINQIRRIRPIIRRHLIAELLRTDQLSSPAPGRGVYLIDADVQGLANLHGFRPAETITKQQEYLQSGALGVLAMSAGSGIGHAWATVCSTEAMTASGYIQIYRGDALIHDCRVHDYFQGRGVYVALLRELADRIFSETGADRILIDTEWSNVASIRGILNAGFAVRYTGTFVQAGRLLIRRSQTVTRQSTSYVIPRAERDKV